MGTWRAFVLRRVLGRLHIGDDIVRHLSTFQRLGETLEVAPPTEMLPVGARTLFRAVRTRAAVQIRPDWLWPRWLDSQLDPRASAFTPRGHLPVMQNVTARNWTAVGNAGSPWEAIVDPAGLVTPWFDAWSLDWWVQAAGRWHLPTREPGLRQGLLAAAPVVVTELDLLGGVVAQRVYGATAGDEVTVVEVENRTAQPLQLALAVRPYNPEGLAVVERIALDGHRVRVDGRDAVRLPDRPLAVAMGTFATGDSVAAVTSGMWRSADRPQRVDDRTGLAQAAFLLDLPPGGLLRAALPLQPTARRRRGRAATPDLAPHGGAVPSAAEVARQWHHRLERGLRVRLPDERLQRAVDANRAYLLLLHDPEDITAGPFTYHRFWFRDAAYQLAALDRWGFAEEAADVLRSYPGRQRGDGFFYSQWREWDANGAAIWAIAEHHRLTGDDALLERLAPAVARGARWIIRTCRGGRGLLPASVSAEHLGPYDLYYWDNLWAWRGLLDAAAIASWRGDEDGAARARDGAAALRRALFASFERDERRLGRSAMPAGPTRGFDAGMIGSLAACYPLRLLAADDPLVRGTAEVIRERLCLGDAFYQGISHTGLGTYLTLQLAFVEMEARDPAAWRRLDWLLDAATPTITWPEAIHPQLPGGCMGDGHHGWTVADLLNFVRMLLVRETDDGVALLTLLPPGWEGERVDVEHAPTHAGRLSYSLEWEGERPLLRWQWDGDAAPLTAPGLDPGWRAPAEPAGEARLAPLSRTSAPAAGAPSS